MKQIKKIAFAIGLGLALTAPAVTLSPPVAAEAADTMGYLDEDYELRTSANAFFPWRCPASWQSAC